MEATITMAIMVAATTAGTMTMTVIVAVSADMTGMTGATDTGMSTTAPAKVNITAGK
jgi:hypothetical protein